jgi:hypothetical protein
MVYNIFNIRPKIGEIMFKGIQNLKAALLITVIATLPATSMADIVSEKIQQCSNSAGTVLKEKNGDASEVSNKAGKKVEKVCYKILCYRTTGNVDNVNFNSIADFKSANLEERGAAEIAFDNNVCTNRTTTVSEDPIGGLDGDADGNGSVNGDGNGNGSVGSGAAFKIKWKGSLYACNAGEDYISCLGRYGITVSGSTSGTVVGTDANGLKIILVTAGGSIDTDVGVTGATAGQVTLSCYEKKCNWWTLCIKDKIVLRDECKGIGAGTTVGSDILIGGDIDAGGDISIGNRGRDAGFYVRYNGRRYRCSAGQSTELCLRDRYGVIMSGSYDPNCADCRARWGNRRGNNGDSWSSIIGATAQLAGNILPSVMMYKGMKVQANAHLGANQAWAGAAATGFEQCNMMQTDYVSATYAHIQANELPDRTVTPPGCNGYSLGQFPGNQGWGNNGWGGQGNMWGSAGYSPQFMASMQGPGGQFGTNFNMSGMNYNPMMGMQAQGNLNLNSMLGLPSNGLNFGVNTGANMGFNNGFNNGMNMNGQFNTGLNGQFNTGIHAGYNGQWGNNGWNTGNNNGWANNSMNFNPQWNATSNGLVPWNNQNGSYWNNTGNNTNNNNWNNGSVNGQNWWNVQNAANNNQQMANQGSYYQQQGLSNHANTAINNMNYNNSNTGYAPFAPSNMGASVGARWGFSF